MTKTYIYLIKLSIKFMYLGRIITKSKNVETIDFVDVTYDKSLVENCTIPTLTIGKKNAIELVGKENVHFLDKKIRDNLYWTFAKTEQRNEYEHDLKKFNDMVLKKIVSGIEYKNLNIFIEPISKIKKFIHFMNGSAKKVIYSSYSMLYVYCKNTVYGISLSDLEYIGVTRKKIYSKLYKNKNNIIITNDYFLTKEIKKCINGNKILVPYVYFLQNV